MMCIQILLRSWVIITTAASSAAGAIRKTTTIYLLKSSNERRIYSSVRDADLVVSPRTSASVAPSTRRDAAAVINSFATTARFFVSTPPFIKGQRKAFHSEYEFHEFQFLFVPETTQTPVTMKCSQLSLTTNELVEVNSKK